MHPLLQGGTETVAEKEDKASEFLFIKADQKLVKVLLAEIRFFEAYGNYIKIHLAKNYLLSKQTLSQFEEQLPAPLFIRIHKSYIVALAHIDYMEGNQIVVAGQSLPVGKMHKEALTERLGKSNTK